MNKVTTLLNKTKAFVIETDIAIKDGLDKIKKPLKNNDGWGKDEVIAIAITLMIAGLIMIPQLKTFAGDVMSEVNSYFDTMKSRIFTTS